LDVPIRRGDSDDSSDLRGLAEAGTQAGVSRWAELKPILETIDGFISVERFESLTEKGKILSLSVFRDEAAVAAWRNVPEHRRTQGKGRASIFRNYRLRIAGVIRDYGMNDREQAPKDSRAAHHAH
jgi:heme-degrading monooxygenase HmoA